MSQRPIHPDPLSYFQPAVRQWFEAVFPDATRPQVLGWPAIAGGDSTLILAPTGTGKTLAAFLWAIDRLMFSPVPPEDRRCRILYISPIKALAVDVERNLRAPLVGIANEARKLGVAFHEPQITIRTGDTPSAERARFARHPSDILITTPESLYLILTSNARAALHSVETVIIDEIHALVPTKRGSHLALSLERLEQLTGRPLQRIGLSATQRPLEEVAHFLGGADVARTPSSAPAPLARSSIDGHAEVPQARSSVARHVSAGEAPENNIESRQGRHTPDDPLTEFEGPSTTISFRPVTIVDAGERKKLDLKIEVALEDMSRLDELEDIPSGPASQGPVRPSIWSAIHPQLLELVRSHNSTLIFVNSRRLAERISGAINELAGEVLVRAHHGSVAVAQRQEIEDRLKMGTLRGLVATSSLELGIDMGAIDLVVQIEAPPSVASGMQRIGRASHTVDAVSNGIIIPKYRADLVASAAVTAAMYNGRVESVHYPRNALDVLAQQVVAMVAMDEWSVDDLFARVRRSAPYAALTRPVFENLLDMLAGRYPSDEFAELRPRLTWDRISNKLTSRAGAKNIAVVNGGTIPDRGLFGVFLAGQAKGARVGELDEEMVFESRAGDTIILGATTWRIESIERDRVVVSPAPGEPGKMPFWHGDTMGRPSEFGEEIGRMTRELLAMPRTVAYAKLIDDHSLDENAAENLLRYLEEQRAATQVVPGDQDILIERVKDELGDWRICVLTPFGSRVHAPWCMAATARLSSELGIDAESMWTDDGFVIRLPESDEPIPTDFLLPAVAEFRDLVLRQLGSTSLFAARFREAAGRALLLPKRRPGKRAPLWQQRKRASDLLAVASRFSTFPILLETYRECVRETFDLPAATSILRKIHSGQIRVTNVDSEKPSPFASALLFGYIANYIYDGDAPLAERRAQALAIDQSQLQELLGDTDLRELLDAAAIEEVDAQLQARDPEYQARHMDGIHDLLLRIGDLSAEELALRCESPEIAAQAQRLLETRRALQVQIAGERRYIAVEDAARYRDALGVPLPPGLPEIWLRPSAEPLLELIRRYARTHTPFTLTEISARFGLDSRVTEPVLKHLHAQGRLLEGEFRPDGFHREWCDSEVLKIIRRRTLARLRREVEPVDQSVFSRLVTRWQGTVAPRRGLDALLDAIELLQGAAVPASDLEREILPARVKNYSSVDLDTLVAAGEVVWVGVERIGERDGRVALYLSQNLPKLSPPVTAPPELSERAQRIIEALKKQGAQFFPALHTAAGGGFPNDTLNAIWELVWAGLVSNDTFHPVRSFLRPAEERRARASAADGRPGSPEFLRRFRSRTEGGAPAHGRWSLVAPRLSSTVTATEWSASMSQQLLTRYGIVMREAAVAENIPNGYSTIYPALRTMEESGWIRRGMFIAGMGAAQFAMTSAVDMLRSLRRDPETIETVHLAASDPANVYGAFLPWPRESEDQAHGMARASGASVILINGALTAFLRRRNPSIRVFLPDDEPDRSQYARALSRQLAEIAVVRMSRKSGLLIGEINNANAREHFLAPFLTEAGFVESAMGFQMRRGHVIETTLPDEEGEDDESVETA
ncbi:MAG TPA: DEAD/DEAH box helicase [Candidatus Margulisiibacteriota bacterium]|nr:DEAD/DEAH box helicase [Candidatus Margulisiibacteriota bacterium]